MTILASLIRFIFWEILVRLVVLIVLGVNIRRRALLPQQGPAIIIANHNSHLDTLVLMWLYSMRQRRHVYPAAAADYFLKNKWLKWFSLHVVNIVPVERNLKKDRHPLQGCFEILERNGILIFFPEGSRGAPEQVTAFKAGIARIAQKYPDVPVTPVFMHGLGQALPKNEFLLVPFFCDIFVGNALSWNKHPDDFMQVLNDRFAALSKEKTFAPWE